MTHEGQALRRLIRSLLLPSLELSVMLVFLQLALPVQPASVVQPWSPELARAKFPCGGLAQASGFSRARESLEAFRGLSSCAVRRIRGEWIGWLAGWMGGWADGAKKGWGWHY